MLQFPSSTPRRHFTKAEIAEMSRGAKVATRPIKPKPDPVIKLIARANTALLEYVLAMNEREKIKGKIENDDWRPPAIYILDGMANLFWSNDFRFSSEQHIDAQFSHARRHIRKDLGQYRASLRRLSMLKGHNIHQLRYERQQCVDSCKRNLQQLTHFLEPMKKAMRKEERRVLAIHRKTGLDKAFLRSRKATHELDVLTRKMTSAKPTSTAGALALIRYVETRLSSDNSRFFSEDGYFPAKLGLLLHRAYDVLRKDVAND